VLSKKEFMTVSFINLTTFRMTYIAKYNFKCQVLNNDRHDNFTFYTDVHAQGIPLGVLDHAVH